MRQAFATLFLLTNLLLFDTVAQNIKGKITDTNGVPMPNATVFIEALNQGTICDEHGEYLLSDVKKGTYKVKASFIGYQTQQKEISVQEYEAIADFVMPEESLTLTEVIVLPNGMDICEYIMKQVDTNRKPLEKKIQQYDSFVTGLFHKDLDLSSIPRRRTIRFALGLFGWKKIFDIMLKYKDLSVTMGEKVHFNKGKITNEGLQILETKPKLSNSEIETFKNKDWFLDVNSYDKFYDLVHDAIKKYKKKNNDKELTYSGSYEEDGRTIFILKYDKAQIEVVDECWQIRRIKYKNGLQNMYFEFYEASPGVFMPIAGNADIDVNLNKMPIKGSIKLGISFKYYNVKK